MTIEIHLPDLETLIQQRMKSGAYRSVEDFLIHALSAPATAQTDDKGMGAGLVAAMQACPVKYIDLEPARYPMPVRDVTF